MRCLFPVFRRKVGKGEDWVDKFFGWGIMRPDRSRREFMPRRGQSTQLDITSGFCGKCATRFPTRGTDTHSCSAEQGNQVRILDMFRGLLMGAKASVTRDSIAVIVKWVRFLRKQVTGGCNGLAGKAADPRRQPRAVETRQSEDLLRASPQTMGLL